MSDCRCDSCGAPVSSERSTLYCERCACRWHARADAAFALARENEAIANAALTRGLEECTYQREMAKSRDSIARSWCRIADKWLRLLCGAEAIASDALRVGLNECARLRAELEAAQGLVAQLLASVAPKCSYCARAATRYVAGEGDNAPAVAYACDRCTPPGKFSRLPNADAIRAAQPFQDRLLGEQAKETNR